MYCSSLFYGKVHIRPQILCLQKQNNVLQLFDIKGENKKEICNVTKYSFIWTKFLTQINQNLRPVNLIDFLRKVETI